MDEASERRRRNPHQMAHKSQELALYQSKKARLIKVALDNSQQRYLITRMSAKKARLIKVALGNSHQRYLMIK